MLKLKNSTLDLIESFGFSLINKEGWLKLFCSEYHEPIFSYYGLEIWEGPEYLPNEINSDSELVTVINRVADEMNIVPQWEN